MRLSSIHFLLSYQCTHECDHCFLFGSPRAKGTMTITQIREVLRQAQELGTITNVCFEGGEPFLFYPVMVQGLREATKMGLRAGIVSNSYWATSTEDAVEWLRPIAEIGVDNLSLSSDLFHGDEVMTPAARHGIEAAKQLGIPESVFTLDVPEGCAAYDDRAKGEPIAGGQVRFRGRAAITLTEGVAKRPWTEFTECPSEDFVNPGRVHVDAHGNVHLCQGVIMGNLWDKPLKEIVAEYDPATHPILGPLMAGGPSELVRRYDLPLHESYADECHLCFQARDMLRGRYPTLLAPPQVYGEL